VGGCVSAIAILFRSLRASDQRALRILQERLTSNERRLGTAIARIEAMQAEMLTLHTELGQLRGRRDGVEVVRAELRDFLKLVTRKQNGEAA
jgi:chromosome segregation ATPase